MAGRANKVTVTLGRRGQVVKNGAGSSDETRYLGAKRSIRERLGTNMENSSFHGGQNNTRRKRAGNGSGHGDGLLGQGPEYPSSIGQNDLRLKLIKKGITKKTSSSGIDLREKLLRKSLKKRESERERERQRERERERQRERELERERGMKRERKMELPQPSYTPYRYAKMRDELGTSNNGRAYMGLSPLDEMSTRPSSSSYVLKNDLIGGSNGVGTRKNIGTAHAQPPPQKLPEMHLSVDELLNSLGLEKYTILFKAEEVDMSALRQMGDGDLKELGIPMGPRKKILLEVRSSAKQRPTH